MLFEAGALAKTLENTFVCPLLIGTQPSDLRAGPLTQFQATVADKEGTLTLLATINRALGDKAMEADRLRRVFDRSWPDFEKRLSQLPQPATVAHRDQREMLEEVLDTVRKISRKVDSPAGGARSDAFRRAFLVRIRQKELDSVLPPVDPSRYSVNFNSSDLPELSERQFNCLISGIKSMVESGQEPRRSQITLSNAAFGPSRRHLMKSPKSREY